MAGTVFIESGFRDPSHAHSLSHYAVVERQHLRAHGYRQKDHGPAQVELRLLEQGYTYEKPNQWGMEYFHWRTHVGADDFTVGYELEDVEDGVELGALGGHVLAGKPYATAGQPQVVEIREAAREQRVHLVHILSRDIEAVRAIGQQGHIVGQGPGPAALVRDGLPLTDATVEVARDELLLQVAHGQQGIDFEEGRGQVVIDALHDEMRVAVR